MHLRRLFNLLLLVPLLAACVVTFGRNADELVICSSLPLAGGDNELAVSMSNAIEMAIQEKGSVQLGGHSYSLRYVAMDDTLGTGSWDTAQEERNARAAITEHGCIAYIGTYNSGAAKIAIPILNRVQMAMISPGNTYPGLTKPDAGLGDEPWIYSPLGPARRNFCRVVPADDLQVPAALEYAAHTLGLRRAFLFHDTELYGKGLTDIFVQEAERFDMEVVAEPLGIDWRRVEQGNSSYSRELSQQILAAEPDLIYFGGVGGHGADEVLGELRRAGYRGPFMGADGIYGDRDVSQANGQGQGELYATLVGLPLSELQGRGREWRGRYLADYDVINDFAAPSYEAALVVLSAIERAEVPAEQPLSLEIARPAVLKAMKETSSANIEGILGEWRFDENCDTSDTTISIGQDSNGTFEFRQAVQAGE